jgi:hypothetical protein
MLEKLVHSQVPQVNRSIGAASCNAIPVRVKRHSCYRIDVLEEAMRCLLRSDIPNMDNLVVTGTRDEAAIGAQGNAPNPILMPWEPKVKALGSNIPQLYGLIISARHEELTVS